MNMQEAIRAVTARRDLTTDEMISVMRIIMTGEATAAQIGGFLIGLNMKGEAVDEIIGAAQVMRELVTRVYPQSAELVDIVGTGGDNSSLFNVSTASAFVVAAAGGKVAKHGNRSVSSKSGSADLLEAAGVRLDLSPEQVARCVDEIGVGFMFAPAHHGAMKHAVGPRREMGVRTIFNLLGPLTNPALVSNQVMGVYGKDWVRPLAEALQRLGSRRVMVVHSEDGLDEISIAAATRVAELKDGEIREYSISPEQFDMQRASLDELKVEDVDGSLALVKKALSKKGGVASDMIALNAGAGIYTIGLSDSLEAGVLMAQDAIGGGLAKEKMSELASFSQCFA